MAATTALSEQDDLDAAWAKVVTECSKIAKWDLMQNAALTVDEVAAKINQIPKTRSSSKEKARAIFLNSLNCINRLGSFAAQAASSAFPGSQQCFGAISFVIVAVQSYNGVFDDIVALMERLSAFLHTLKLHVDKQDSGLQLDPRLRPAVYRVLGYFLEIMAKAYRLTNDWKAKFKVALKIGAFGDDDGIKSSLAELEKLVIDVTRVQITVIVEDLSEAARNIVDIDHKVDKVIDGLKAMSTQEAARLAFEHDETDRQRIRSLDIVEGATFDSDRNTRHSECVSNTRTDILQRIQLWAAEDTDQTLFWLGGIAGTGKSTIAKTMGYLLKEDYHVLSFFFERGSGDASSSKKVFRTIAYQLSFVSQQLRHSISEAIAQDETLCRSSAISEQLKRLIVRPLGKWRLSDNYKRIILILDALDECEDADEIRKLLPQISEAGLRTIVTSRPDVASKYLRDLDSTHYEELMLCGDPRAALDADIQTFLVHELKIIRRSRGLELAWPSDNQIQVLVDKAEGLFIFAATVCRFIKGSKWIAPSRRLDEICTSENTGAKATQQLDNMYTTILTSCFENEDEEELEYIAAATRQVIGTLVLLRDNISIADLICLLGDFADEAPRVDDIIQNLQAVIYVGADGLVRLIHLSFRDFLLDNTRCKDPRLQVDAKQMHYTLAERCLDIMKEQLHENMCEVTSPGIYTSEIDEAEIDARVPVALRYACRFWMHHIVACNVELRDGGEVHEFLRNYALHYFETMGLIGRIGECVTIFRCLHALYEVGCRTCSTSQSLTITQPEDYPALGCDLYDLMRFITTYRYIAETAPLQLYYTAAYFSPKNSIVRNYRFRSIPGVVSESQAAEDWDSCRVIIEGHLAAILHVRFSPDGDTLVTSSYDGTVRVWETDSGECTNVLTGYEGLAYLSEFSPDGSMLASGHTDGSIRLLDAQTWKCRFTKFLRLDRTVQCLLFTQDSSWLISGASDTELRLWNVQSAQCERALEGKSHQWYNSLDQMRLCADGVSILFTTLGNVVTKWDFATGECCNLLSGAELTSPSELTSLSLDGSSVAQVSREGIVRIWNAESDERQIKLDDFPSDKLMTIELSKHGLELIGCTGTHLWIWNAWSGGCVWRDMAHFGYPRASAPLSADGKEFAMFQFGGITFWDLQKEKRSGRIEGVEPGTLQFSPDGLTVAVESGETVRIIDRSYHSSANLEDIRGENGHSSSIMDVQVCSMRSIVATLSEDRTVKIWNLTSGKCELTLEDLDHEMHDFVGPREFRRNRLSAVRLSPDGSTIACGCSVREGLREVIKVWSVASGQHQRTIEAIGMKEGITEIKFAPRGDTIAYGGGPNGDIRIWTEGDQVQLTGHSDELHGIYFSPDGTVLVSQSHDSTVRIWDARTGECRFKIAQSCTEGPGNGDSICFTPDGSALVTYPWRGPSYIWDVRTGQCIEVLGTKHDVVLCVDVSPCSSNIMRLCYNKYDEQMTRTRNELQLCDMNTGESLWQGTVEEAERESVLSSRQQVRLLEWAMEHLIRRLSGWVSVSSGKLLWLPPAYRPGRLGYRCLSTHIGNILILGSGHGRVTFVRLSHEDAGTVAGPHDELVWFPSGSNPSRFRALTGQLRSILG